MVNLTENLSVSAVGYRAGRGGGGGGGGGGGTAIYGLYRYVSL